MLVVVVALSTSRWLGLKDLPIVRDSILLARTHVHSALRSQNRSGL
jgi:hypothetical protein